MVLVVVLMVPTVSFAESGQIGVYVAPKFIAGGLMGHDVDFTWETIDKTQGGGYDRKTGSQSFDGDWVYGGAIAIGYDFYHRFDIPVRLELEYSMFGDAKSENKYKSSSSVHTDWENEKSTITIGVQTLFMNAYYDFRNSSNFTPYLGAGLGAAFVDMKGKTTRTEHDPDDCYSYSLGKESSTNFAWNIGAGVAYSFTDNISLDLGYRFVGLGKGETKYGDSSIENGRPAGTERQKWETEDMYVHQVMAGVRFSF
jgi:opacity protein-like surface antigen